MHGLTNLKTTEEVALSHFLQSGLTFVTCLSGNTHNAAHEANVWAVLVPGKFHVVWQYR